MSEAPAEPVETPIAEPKSAEQAGASATPPWGDTENFNAEKAWDLVQNLRTEVKVARGEADDDLKAEIAEYRKLRGTGSVADMRNKIAEFDRLAEASKTELERAQEAASKSSERIQAITRRAVEAEVKSAAAGFADPSDAAAFLDLSKYANEDGDINTEAITTDLAALLESKPHLGKPAGPVDPRAPKPNPAQGAGGGGASPTREALIAEATSKGDWQTAIALQNQKLLTPGTA